MHSVIFCKFVKECAGNKDEIYGFRKEVHDMSLEELFGQVGSRAKCESDVSSPLHCGGGSTTQSNKPDCTQSNVNARCSSNTTQTTCSSAFTTC